MREYIENKLAYLEEELEREWQAYQNAIRNVRETTEKYITEDNIKTSSKYNRVRPDDVYETQWILHACKNVKERAGYVKVTQDEMLLLRKLLAELYKYESPGTVTVDDAARKIADGVRFARLTAARYTLKKDEAERNRYIGAADAGVGALKALGYTDEQVEEMVK
jgi:hypothetical protein